MHQDVLVTRYVEGKEDQVEKVLYQLADIEYTNRIPKDFILLPTHPYQINVLRQHPQYMQYSEQGLIKDLGVSGDSVYPTSSVRTVFSKALNIYLKLPIHVKITNFIRTNMTLNRLNGQLMPRKLSHQSKMRLKHPILN